METPFGFKVELDPDLFTLDRLDDLYRRGVAAGNARGRIGGQPDVSAPKTERSRRTVPLLLSWHHDAMTSQSRP